MKKIIFGIGAVLSGIFASICCLGPIVLALFGLSFVGLAQLHKYRPIFIVISLLFLGFAFYSIYRKREIKCSDGTCRIETSNKTTKIILWVITVIVLAAISFLWWYPILVAKLDADNSTVRIFSQSRVKEQNITLDCSIPAKQGNSENYEIIGACCE